MNRLAPESTLHVLASPAHVTMTSVPEAGLFEFVTHHDNSPSTSTYAKGYTPNVVRRVSDTLAAMYLGTGSGYHDFDTLHEAANISPKLAGYVCRTLVDIMPRNAATFFVDRVHRTPFSVWLGQLSLAERPATPEERDKFEKAKQAAAEDTLQLRRRGLLFEEQHKSDLTMHTCSLITCGDKQYALDLDSPESIILCRTIEAANKARYQQGVGRTIAPRTLVNAAWEGMSIAERNLFIERETALYGNGEPIKAQVGAAIPTLYTLGILTKAGQSYRLEINNLQTTHLAEQPEQLPPGTRPLRLQHLPHLSHPEAAPPPPAAEPNDQIEKAIAILTTAAEFGEFGLEHDDAVRMLTFVMDRRGKHAIEAALQQMEATEAGDDAVHRLKTLAREALGWDTYRVAEEACIIGRFIRNRCQGKARHTSGRSKANGVEMRWVIG